MTALALIVALIGIVRHVGPAGLLAILTGFPQRRGSA